MRDIKKISTKKLFYYFVALSIAVAITIFSFWWNFSDMSLDLFETKKNANPSNPQANFNLEILNDDKMKNLKEVFVQPLNLKMGKNNPFSKD